MILIMWVKIINKVEILQTNWPNKADYVRSSLSQPTSSTLKRQHTITLND